MDSILARLDDRLRKFSGTEESGKDGEVGQVGKGEENGNHDWASEGVKSPEGRAENLGNEKPPTRENGVSREELVPYSEPKPVNGDGSNQNGNSERVVSVESGVEDEGGHLSEADTDSEPPKSPDLPSHPSPSDSRPNRAPSASSFRSKK